MPLMALTLSASSWQVVSTMVVHAGSLLPQSLEYSPTQADLSSPFTTGMDDAATTTTTRVTATTTLASLRSPAIDRSCFVDFYSFW
uniref:Secreted protein n=1 Tax=Triticum urartu TaxID=4572 RepID=A0A8R7TBF0_TRIUA